MGEQDTTARPIRVVVVDDHPIVRVGLSAMLRTAEGLALVGEAADGEEALRVCAEVQPEVVLLDLQLPQRDGVSTLGELRHRDPSLQVLVLTASADDQRVGEAIQAGAIGYLTKDVDGQTLQNAIRAARTGQLTLSSTATQALVRAVATGLASASVPARELLTAREREVLALLVRGRRTKEIADRLVISRATVRYHVGRLFVKLGVSSRVELVAVALQRHLLD